MSSRLAYYRQLANEHTRARARIAELEVQMDRVWREMTPEETRSLDGASRAPEVFYGGPEEPTKPGSEG